MKSSFSALSHLRPLHPVRVDPRSRVLRSPGGLPRALPFGGEGARLRRGLASLRRLRRPRARSHGPRGHGSSKHPRSHVLCLNNSWNKNNNHQNNEGNSSIYNYCVLHRSNFRERKRTNLKNEEMYLTKTNTKKDQKISNRMTIVCLRLTAKTSRYNL